LSLLSVKTCRKSPRQSYPVSTLSQARSFYKHLFLYRLHIPVHFQRKPAAKGLQQQLYNLITVKAKRQARRKQLAKPEEYPCYPLSRARKKRADRPETKRNSKNPAW